MVVVLTVVDPAITTQPVSISKNAGEQGTFRVMAEGTPPLSYQWLKDRVKLSDTASVQGATTATLSFQGVLRSDTGNYWVVISNSSGGVTSVVAALTVLDPGIITQPAGASRALGGKMTFKVTAVGTGPLGYQWWKDGVALAGATQSSLALTNIHRSDAGGYLVVVSNAFGSATLSEYWLSGTSP